MLAMNESTLLVDHTAFYEIRFEMLKYLIDDVIMHLASVFQVASSFLSTPKHMSNQRMRFCL